MRCGGSQLIRPVSLAKGGFLILGVLRGRVASVSLLWCLHHESMSPPIIISEGPASCVVGSYVPIGFIYSKWYIHKLIDILEEDYHKL